LIHIVDPFTILNNTPTDASQKVIIDLDLEVEDVEEQLNAFRAEEVARAAIAEANYKSFLDKQRGRSAGIISRLKNTVG
jgi:hypothetical protein